MASLNESSFRKQLESEGFSHTYVWQDASNAHYPDHTHAGLTAHIILDGEMTVTIHGAAETYRPGDRFNIPAKTMHAARMGSSGCRYLIGEK